MNALRRIPASVPLLALLLLLPLLIGPNAAAWLADRAAAWRGPIERLGAVPGAALVAIATAAAVVLGTPRLPLAAAAGLLLGLPVGLAASILGSLAGAWGDFAIARRAAGRPCGPADIVRPDDSLLRRLRCHGPFAVALLRLAPLPGAAINLLLAVTPCTTRDFLLGSVLGFLPEAVPAVLAGARLAAARQL